MEDHRIDKSKIVTNALTISLAIVISVVFLGALYIVVKPIMKDDNMAVSASDMSDYMNVIESALNKVSKDYIDDVEMQKLVEGALHGITGATEDPYTRYMTEAEYQEMLVSGTEVYGGLGIHITYDKDADGIIIIGLMPNSPALEAGLKAGDVIKKVGDTIVTVESYYDCVDQLKGEENTQVTITVLREGTTFEKTVTRKKITTNNVESNILDGNIGYIKIWSFDNDIYKQFKAAYDELKSKNVTGLVIDVRNNPGGLVSDTVQIAQQLLPKCDILKLVYKSGYQKVYRCDGKNEIQMPLAILVNARSASASEILAGSVKDSGKGAIIGNKTFGKGIVQTIEPLQNKMGALSITTSKYYTASGVEIHKNGIEPTITVDLPEDVKDDMTIPYEKDTQLQRAVEYIRTQK